MADKKRPTDVRKTASNINSKWLKNTLKSLGVASSEMFKDIMPATAETLSSATSSATEVVRNLRTSKTGVSNIARNIKNSQGVKMGQDFFRNAIDDLKSGNLYNTERDSTGGAFDDFNTDNLFGDVEDVSFGDMGDAQQVNVVNQEINQDTAAGAATLKAIEKSTEYNVRATKASVDTMISIASTNMLSMSRMSSEIVSQLTSINSNIAALVEYQNTNMTKFIDASIGYYEQMNQRANAGSSGSGDADNITAEDLYSAGGGLDFSAYKRYIKKNIKEYKDSNMVGSTVSMILDNKELLLGGLIANPIGTVMKASMKAILPQVTKNAVAALDRSIKDFIPVMLERIGTLDVINGEYSAVGAFLAKVFGTKTERKTEFDLKKIEKGPMPYNGMANHAIIEIIPKHLREANSYLQIIAEAITGQKGAKGKEVGFDWTTGKFTDMEEIRKNFFDEIQTRTTNEFRNSKFGEKMSAQRSLLRSQADQDKYDEALDQLYTLIERHKGALDFSNHSHIEEIMSGINTSDSIKNLIESYIQHLQETSDEAIGNAIATKQRVTREKNKVMQDAEDRAYENNLRNFISMGGYDKYIDDKYRKKSGATVNSDQSGSALASHSIPGLIQNIYDLLNRGIYVQFKSFNGSYTPKFTQYSNEAPTHGPSSQPPIPPISDTQSKEYFRNNFVNVNDATLDIDTDDSNLSWRQRFGRRSEKSINMFKGVIDGIMAGNSDKAFDEFMNAMRDKFHRAGEWISEKFFQPIKKSLFGEKDEDGYTRGGIFEGFNNRLKESYYSLRRMINGRGYITADGNKVEDAKGDELNNTVKGKLMNALAFVRDGIKEKLFGKEADEESGEEGKEGVLGKARRKIGEATSSLLKGFSNWKKTLFGTDIDDEEDDEENGKKVLDNLKKKASEMLPTAVTGAVGGAIAGNMAGGVLGWAVGGPIGGALLGLAASIASRSEKFKDWLFGPEDKDGKRIGGVISEKVQDYVKQNGKYLAGGAALGLAKGIILPSEGALATLVGGPLAGAVMGVATSVIVRSNMFQRFLFGDEKTGQKGLVNTVKGWFGKLGRGKDGDPNTGKLLGMAGIGMGVGAITVGTLANSGILGLSLGPMGPIGGALLGLGTAILAQKKNFKEWLFGTVDPETGEKRLGVIGRFGKMMSVNVFRPMKDSVVNMSRKFAHFVEHDVLTKFNLIIEPIGKAFFGSISKFTGKAVDSLAGVGDVIKENFLMPALERFKNIIKPIADVGRKAGEAILNVGLLAVKSPIKMLYAITSPIAQAVAKTAKTAVGAVTTAIKWTIVKPIQNFVIKPLSFATKTAIDVISAPFKLVSKITTTIVDKVGNLTSHISMFLSNLGTRFKDWLLVKNPVAKTLRGFGKRVKDFGARVKNTFKLMVAPLTDFVKTALTEVKNQVTRGISKFFSFLNPINIIKGLYNVMRGRRKEDNDPTKMGYFRKLWWMSDPDNFGYDDPDSEVWKNANDKTRRKWAERNAKWGYEKSYYTLKDGTQFVNSRDGKFMRVTYPNGKQELITTEAFHKKYPNAKDMDIRKSGAAFDATIDEEMQKTVSGSKYSEYENRKAKKLSRDITKNQQLIAKWTGYRKEDVRDTLENRMIAEQIAAKKGKKINWAGASPLEEATVAAERERLGLDQLEAEQETADNTKDTASWLERIYLSMRYGWSMSEDEQNWIKHNKDLWKKKANFFNGRRNTPEEYDASEAEAVGEAQAATTNSEAYSEASRKGKKATDKKYSNRRQNRAENNYHEYGFFEGLKRNWKDTWNYMRGARKYNKSEDDVPRHATGTSHSKEGFAVLGEYGPELVYDEYSSKGRFVGLSGPEVQWLHGGSRVIPNNQIGGLNLTADVSDFSDSDLIKLHDTAKLSIGERILHEILRIRTTMEGINGGINLMTGGGVNENFDTLSGIDNVSTTGGIYHHDNISQLYHRLRSVGGAALSYVPGAGLVRKGGRVISGAAGIGKNVLGVGFDAIRNTGTFVHNMFHRDDKEDNDTDATITTLALRESAEEREARENAAQEEVNRAGSAEVKQARLALEEETLNDNNRDEERNSLLQKISDKLGGFKDMWGSIFSKKGLIGSALFVLGSVVSKFIPSIYKWTKKFLSDNGGVGGIIQSIRDKIPTLSELKDTIWDVPNKIKSLWATTKETVANAATAVWGWIYDHAGGFIDTAKDTFVSFGRNFADDAKFGIYNLGDGKTWADKGIDNLARFTRTSDINGNLDHQSEARFKNKAKFWTGLANRNLTPQGYDNLFAYGTEKSGLRKLWDRVNPSNWKNYGSSSVISAFPEEIVEANTLHNGVVYAGTSKGATIALPGANAAGHLVGYGDEAVRAGETLFDQALRVGEKNIGKEFAEDASASIARNAAKAAAEKEATNEGLWKKVTSMLSKAFKGIGDKVAGKYGGTKAGKAVAGVSEKVMKNVTKCKSGFAKVTGKIASVLGITAGLGATVVGLAAKEGTWIAIGVLNGATGAQRLFRTNEVDTLMQIISTVIGGLLGTTVGAIIDIINELVVSMTGIDIVSELATLIYTCIMNFTGNQEMSEKLREGQEAFQAQFEKDKTASLKEQYATMKRVGLLDASVTEAEYIQGAQEGKYAASIKSFADYNDEQHKTMGANVLDKSKGALTTLKSNLIGKTETTYIDKKGNVYTDAGDGTWLVKSSEGKELGLVAKEAIPEDAEENVEKTEGTLIRLGKAIWKMFKPLIGCVGAALPSIIGDFTHIVAGEPLELFQMAELPEDTPWAGIAKALMIVPKITGFVPACMSWIGWRIWDFLGPVVDGIGATVSGVVGSVSHGINAFLSGDIGKLWGGNWDSKSHGYNEGDGVGSGIGAGIAYAIDVGARLVLTVPTLMSGVFHKIWDVIGPVVDGTKDLVTSISDTVEGMVDWVKNAWQKTKDTFMEIVSLGFYDSDTYNGVSDAVAVIGSSEDGDESLGSQMARDFMTGNGGAGFGGKGADNSNSKVNHDNVDTAVNKLTDKYSPSIEKADSNASLSTTDDADRKKFGKPITNLQDVSTDNNTVYVSQNDPRWSSVKFARSDGKDDGATIGTTGCGPATMSMAIADNTGQMVSPIDLARYAQIKGYRDDTGTNSVFISSAASKYNMQSSEVNHPTTNVISTSLKNGEYPVLLGRKSNHGPDDGSSPYTRDGHYIIATGFDRNGNITINDPRGPEYNISVDPDKLAQETISMWRFSGSNSLMKRRSLIKRRMGGFGNEYLSWLQSDSRWGNKHLGDSDETMSSAGCYVTTLAKLIVHTNSISNDDFNPGWLCEYFNKANAFDKSGNLNTGCLPNLGMSKMGKVSLNGKSESDIIKQCSKYIDKGFAIALWLKPEHAVAIVDISNGKLIMSDPSQNTITNVFEKYSASNVDSLTYFQGAKSPKKVNFEYSGDDGEGVISKVKSIIEPVAEVGGAFAKFATAIFKAILTGNWDIDWDSVYADESDDSSSSNAATTTTGQELQLMNISPDNYKAIDLDTDATNAMLPAYSYLRNKLGFNKWGAAAVLSMIYNAQKGAISSKSNFDPGYIPTDAFKDRSTYQQTTGIPFYLNLPNFDQFNSTMYNFALNSGLLSTTAFTKDSTIDGLSMPYGLLQWDRSDSKLRLQQYMLSKKSNLNSYKNQLNFIKEDIGKFSSSMLEAMTTADGNDYRTIMDSIPGFIGRNRFNGNDVSLEDIYNGMMTIYDYYKMRNGSVNLDDASDMLWANNVLSFKDYADIKLANNLDLASGEKSNIFTYNKTGNHIDVNAALRNKQYGFAKYDSIQKRVNAIKKIYKDRGLEIPSMVLRQIYKDRTPEELDVLTHYYGLKSIYDKISDDDLKQMVDEKFIKSMEASPTYNISDILKSHKLPRSSYEASNNRIYDRVINGSNSPDISSNMYVAELLEYATVAKNADELSRIRSILNEEKGDKGKRVIKILTPNASVFSELSGKSNSTFYTTSQKYDFHQYETDKGYMPSIALDLTGKIGNYPILDILRAYPEFSDLKFLNVRAGKLLPHSYTHATDEPGETLSGRVADIKQTLTEKSKFSGRELYKLDTERLRKREKNSKDIIDALSHTLFDPENGMPIYNTRTHRIVRDDLNPDPFMYPMTSDNINNIKKITNIIDNPNDLLDNYDNPQRIRTGINKFDRFDPTNKINNYASLAAKDKLYGIERTGSYTYPPDLKPSEIPGGSGEGVNGSTYYSQNDPRWSSNKFIQSNGTDDGATMASSGCGPTAMAMALSDATNSRITPTQTARLAQAMGDRDETGVNWNFVGDAANYYGVNAIQSLNPSKNFIESSLRTGSPLVLSGQSDGSSNSIYTSSGHYVVANGIDGSGNVMINDPRGRMYSHGVSVSDILKDTGSAWLIGSNLNALSSANRNRGGRGDDWKEWKQSDPRWGDKVMGGGGATIAMYGCALVSCAKLIKLTNSTSDPDFDPGKLCDMMNANGGFSSSGLIYWDKVPYITFEGSADFDQLTRENISNTVAKLMKDGYVVILECKGGEHWVPVISVDGTNITMSDSASNKSDDFFTEYSPDGCCTYKWFKGSTSASNYASTSAATVSNESDDEFGGASNLASKLGNEIFKAGYTGNWDIDWDTVFADAVNNDSTSASVSATGTTSVRGNSNAQKIFNYLKDNMGFSDAGATGVLGNWQTESGLLPNNLENTFESELGYDDESYTAALNSGKYTRNQFIHDAEHRSSYVTNCGIPVGAGYGLAQWTSGSRKGELYDATIGKGYSIDDLGAQLAFASAEMGNGNYSSLLNTLRTTTSPETAASQFLGDFEGCPGHSSESLRQSRARDFYNELHGGSGAGIGTAQPDGKITNEKIRKFKQSIKRHDLTRIKKRGGHGTAPTLKLNNQYVNAMKSTMKDGIDSSFTPEYGTHPSVALSYQERQLVQNYGGHGSSDMDDMKKMMSQVIQYLGAITGNTDNLSLLKDISSGVNETKNTFITNATNNVKSNSGSSKAPSANRGQSRNEQMARKIAFTS